MITFINGKPSTWSVEILDKWITEWKKTGDHRPYNGTVSTCNYFTPRPYVDDYNLGDTKKGFVYTIGRYRVAMAVVTGGVPWRVSRPQRGLTTAKQVKPL